MNRSDRQIIRCSAKIFYFHKPESFRLEIAAIEPRCFKYSDLTARALNLRDVTKKPLCEAGSLASESELEELSDRTNAGSFAVDS